MDIREALSKLDTMEDSHWNSDGFPKIEAVKELLGGPVTRQQIIDAAPHFSRSNPIVEDEVDEKIEAETEEEVTEDFFSEFVEKEPMDVNVFLGFLMTVPKGNLIELQNILESQQKNVAENRKKLDEMDLRIRHAILHTKNRISREIPDISEREANQLYIQRQQELRAAKHAATTALLKGIDLRSLDPRSAIDRAMSRKTARGTQRPNFNKG